MSDQPQSGSLRDSGQHLSDNNLSVLHPHQPGPLLPSQPQPVFAHEATPVRNEELPSDENPGGFSDSRIGESFPWK